MQNISGIIEKVNTEINKLVWGTPMLVLLLAVGIYFTIRLKFFQIFKIRQTFSKRS